MGAEAVEEQFGPYMVYERLGVGGMATVHRALEAGVEGFERVVALKRLLPHLAEDASFIKAFVREAKLASLLNHVNIVQIYELGRVGTEYFISMEYIDGRDVRRILRHARKVTGPPPIHVTVGLITQLCDALDYAHSKLDEDGNPLGLVHRDVSPSNLLVTGQGHLKVIDFGIAKAQSSQLRTQTGRVKGKLAYMAPEAVSGSRDLDARSDVWAVGVILHELLTARPLFASKNEYQTLIKVQRGDITPPSAFNQACPPELDAIVYRALARDPDDRYSAAVEVRDELVALRNSLQLATRPRDISSWLDWAFAQELPAGFSGNTLEPPSGVAMGTSRSPRSKSPPVIARDEDEAVEMVWGTSDAPGSGPVVLDEVPDVSSKHHIRAETDVEPVGGPRADDDIDDDIPTPKPSHGSAPSISRRAHRNTAPGVAPAATARTSERLITAPTAAINIGDAAATDPVGSPALSPKAASALAGDDLFDIAIEPPVPHDDPAATMPDRRAGLALPLAAPPRTKPGVQPVAARKERPSISPATEKPVIGASMVERNKGSKRWVLVVGLLLLAGGGAGIAWYAMAGSVNKDKPIELPQQPESHDPGIVKFDTVPADAEVRVEGQAHAGSPWSIELAPGTHQIEIRHSGYKSWLTSVDLAPKQVSLLRVVLEPLGAKGTASSDATLSLTTTPAGLDVTIDGRPLAMKTPIKLTIKTGAHAIAVKQNGVEVWHQSINAEAASDYEFNPVIGDKPKPPQKRTATDEFIAPEQAPAPSPSTIPTTPSEAPPAPATPIETPVDAQPAPAPVLPAMPVPAPAPQPPHVDVKPPPRPTGPVTVPPKDVTKLSGELPNMRTRTTTELPAVVPAKLCIDTNGRVASVELLTKIDKRIADELVAALRTWRYAPYIRAGSALDACFVVTLRMK